jgi:hypothetical protein
MAPPLDPYRTLGLAPGAGAEEIRRAYRRLAKANHPDFAGEAALPRFLAIQAAYEMLVDVPPGRRSAARGTPRQPADTTRADPGRARSTRNAYTRRQSAGAGPSGPGAGPSGSGASGPGARGTRPGAAGARPSAAGAGPSDNGAADLGARPRRPGGKARSPNKATLGSTSYDAAEDEPFEPEWSGGTWYGASSGTYWTLNPKEYADPRKHGPEYQRRARRIIDGVDVDPADEGPSIAGDDFDGPDSETAAGGPGRSHFDGRWAYPDDSGAAASAPPDAGAAWEPAGPGPESTPPSPPSPPAAPPSLSAVGERLLRGDVGPVGRIGLAFVGWLPIGAFIAWIYGELTGCGRFTASCVDPGGTWTLIPQLIVIVVLAAVPWLAALSAAGTIGALAASVPAAVVLSAAGGSHQPDTSAAIIGIVFAVGYVAGTAFAAGRRLGWRRVP